MIKSTRIRADAPDLAEAGDLGAHTSDLNFFPDLPAEKGLRGRRHIRKRPLGGIGLIDANDSELSVLPSTRRKVTVEPN